MNSRRFARQIQIWYERAKRDLPWRRTRDPYRILVSEIMLQQTRVETVLPYYARFLERFPTAAVLARAPESDVLAAWSGLGYYSRARNLQKAAARIVEARRFPGTYDEIRALPGVGDYTAAAVASIAFNLPHAAVDGNVLRVMARLTGDSGDIGSASTRMRLAAAAAEVLNRRDPAGFNQALMELGATVCVPRNPRCPDCPVREHCRAHAEDAQHRLPVKLRRTTPVRIDATLLLIERKGRVLMWQRPAGPRLAGFWELPSPEQLPAASASLSDSVGEFRHTITHHQYRVTVLRARLGRAPRPFRWLDRTALATVPLSTTARKALHL